MSGDKNISKQILLYDCSQEIVSEVRQLAEPCDYGCRVVSSLAELRAGVGEEERILILEASDFAAEIKNRPCKRTNSFYSLYHHLLSVRVTNHHSGMRNPVLWRYHNQYLNH